MLIIQRIWIINVTLS